MTQIIGNGPNQVSRNADLGKLAFLDDVSQDLTTSLSTALLTAPVFQQSGSSTVARTLISKLEDYWVSVDDYTSLAAADVSGKAILISSVITVTSNITLVGNYTFIYGGMIQAASGVTVTWQNSIWSAGKYQHIIDTSLGGVHTGHILNESFSVCWTGADPTGGALSGPAIQAAIDYRLCKTIEIPDNPDGSQYIMGSAQILQKGVYVTGTPRAAGEYAGSVPTLYWDTDLGKSGDATSTDSWYWRIPSLEEGYGGVTTCELSNLILSTYGDSSTKSITPLWNTDLLVIGKLGLISNDNYSTCQAHITNVTFSGGRMGSVNRTMNGHTFFRNCIWESGFGGAATVMTGGDYHYLECNAQSQQCSGFYHWSNTGWEQGLIINQHRTGQCPYTFFQEQTVHPGKASDGDGTISAGYRFTDMTTEALGNGFFYCPNSGLYEGFLDNCVHDLGWYGFGAAYTIQSMPYDYGYVFDSWINSRMIFGKDGSGFGTMGNGNKGSIYCSSVCAIKVVGLIQQITGVPYITAPLIESFIGNVGWATKQLVFQPEGTVQDGTANTEYGYGGHSDGQTYDYALNNEELSSTFHLNNIHICQSDGTAVASTADWYNRTQTDGVFEGCYVRVILATPVTSTTYFQLNLFSISALI